MPRFSFRKEVFSMRPAVRQNYPYHPHQPIFEKILDTYKEHRTDASPLFQGGVIFYGFHINALNENRIFVVPDGCLHLVVCCHKEHPSANICGTIFKGRQGVFVRSDCEYFVICFMPGYAEFFLKYPIGEFSELEIPVQEVFPYSDELLEKIAEQSTFEGRIRAFEAFYLKHYRMGLEIPLLVKYLTEKIITIQGALNVKELAEDTGYSNRYLLKSFEKFVGVSPKLLSRIVRFQNVIHSLEHKHYEQTLDRIFEMGYFDQNHFIKEFKEFSFITPKKYIQQIDPASTLANGVEPPPAWQSKQRS
ncbi:helix-turn-helix domain-containing protein [Paenibacillus sp. NPDC058071]|uniref:helix-turn-helix domain-containing protein n=1 Tax=Paenibacillus sp. NPDC058071 TaxID=3346326 RepID=UPI0036D87245